MLRILWFVETERMEINVTQNHFVMEEEGAETQISRETERVVTTNPKQGLSVLVARVGVTSRKSNQRKPPQQSNDKTVNTYTTITTTTTTTTTTTNHKQQIRPTTKVWPLQQKEYVSFHCFTLYLCFHMIFFFSKLFFFL